MTLYWPTLRPHLWEMHNSQTHFLFKGSGHTLVPHSLETSGMWDRTRLRHTTSLKDWFARQRAALFRENISGEDDSSLLFWRFPVLSWAKGRLKCTEEDHSLVTPSFFPATRITAGHISNPPTNRSVSCVWGKRSYWLCWEGVWEVRAVFISHCVHLDSFQQHLRVLAERAGKESW